MLDFSDAPGPASPAAFLGTTVAFLGRKRTRGATAQWTLLEVGQLCIHNALSVAGLRRGMHVPSALLGPVVDRDTGVHHWALGKPGERRCPADIKQNPRELQALEAKAQPLGWAAPQRDPAARHCG